MRKACYKKSKKETFNILLRKIVTANVIDVVSIRENLTDKFLRDS